MLQIRTLLLLTALLLSACDKPAPYEARAEEVFPAMEIKQAALFRMDQLGITQDFFQGRWTAVAFATAECPADCRHRLALLNQSGDAQALLVFTDIARHDQMRALKKSFPRVEVSMGATASSLDLFIEQFNDSSITSDERANYIYLVNPERMLTHAVPASAVEPGDIEQELALLTGKGMD